jgi:SAM-dependent methyltransferase
MKLLNRKSTNAVRFVLDEMVPPFIRDSRTFMYPFYQYWFKGKNISRIMEFKSYFHELSDSEIQAIYCNLECRANDRTTDLNTESLNYILANLDASSETLIDVGCGKGFFMEKVSKLGRYKVAGCDLFEELAINGGSYYHANIENLPFAAKQFDIVTCNHTLEHVIHLERAISELKRIARKQLVITVPCQRYYYYTLDLHIHFFPLKSMLINAMGIDNHTCVNQAGDLVYIGRL